VAGLTIRGHRPRTVHRKRAHHPPQTHTFAAVEYEGNRRVKRAPRHTYNYPEPTPGEEFRRLVQSLQNRLNNPNEVGQQISKVADCNLRLEFTHGPTKTLQGDPEVLHTFQGTQYQCTLVPSYSRLVKSGAGFGPHPCHHRRYRMIAFPFAIIEMRRWRMLGGPSCERVGGRDFWDGGMFAFSYHCSSAGRCNNSQQHCRGDDAVCRLTDQASLPIAVLLQQLSGHFLLALLNQSFLFLRARFTDLSENWRLCPLSPSSPCRNTAFPLSIATPCSRALLRKVS